MPLNASTLATELANIEPTDDEAVVRAGWRLAFGTYFAESSVKGVTPIITPYDPGPPEVPLVTPYDAALDQFALALTGISLGVLPTDGAMKIATAHAAFWTAIAPLVASVWIVAPPLASLVTPPAGVLAIPAYVTALSAVFVSNRDGALSKVDCYNAIAAVIHGNNTGATVLDTTTPTPLTLPIL